MIDATNVGNVIYFNPCFVLTLNKCSCIQNPLLFIWITANDPAPIANVAASGDKPSNVKTGPKIPAVVSAAVVIDPTVATSIAADRKSVV